MCIHSVKVENTGLTLRGSYRVEMNVSRYSGYVLITSYKLCAIPALQAVAWSVVLVAEVHAVGCVESLHEFLDVSQGRLNEEMEMVLHQCVGVEDNLVFLKGCLQLLKESGTVVLGNEDILSAISARSNMVLRPFISDSPRSGHGLITLKRVHTFSQNRKYRSDPEGFQRGMFLNHANV